MGIGRLIFTVLAAILTVWSVLNAVGGAWNLVESVGRDRTVDGWDVLRLAEIVCAVGGVAGAWLSLRRRAYGWAALFLAIQLPGGFLIEANRCDVLAMCEYTDWARLPRAFFEWSIALPH